MLVVPKNPTKNGVVVELSNIDDQQGLRAQAPVIMAFKGRPCTPVAEAKKDPAIVIREALARTLDFYYPFAGRIREDINNRKLLVDCNSQGVLFIEADADVTLKDIQPQILPPCPLLEDLVFDVPGSTAIIGCPLLLFQVTRLQCGGHILGMRFNHTMCDMLGLMQFLYAMVELSRGAQKPSIMPVWQRDLLCARNPPRVTYTHHEYQKAGDITNVPILKKNEDNLVREGFFFDSQTIEMIRNHLPPHLRNSVSTFELICAYVWRCRVLALQPDPEDTVQFSMTISVRDNNIIPLPRGYYGNSFVSPAITTKAKELMCNIDDSLAYALQIVKNSREKVNEEYVRSMIDLMEVEGRPKYKEPHVSWLATNLTRKGLDFADFGWGTPTYCGVPQATSLVGTFTRFKNEQGKDIISVVLYLPKEVMTRFKTEFGKFISTRSNL